MSYSTCVGIRGQFCGLTSLYLSRLSLVSAAVHIPGYSGLTALAIPATTIHRKNAVIADVRRHRYLLFLFICWCLVGFFFVLFGLVLVFCFVFLFFETKFLCIVQTVLELAL